MISSWTIIQLPVSRNRKKNKSFHRQDNQKAFDELKSSKAFCIYQEKNLKNGLSFKLLKHNLVLRYVKDIFRFMIKI